MEMNPIFKYESPRRFLIDYVSHKQSTDESFSLRKWTKSMGMNSHAQLVMILQGKRPLTLKQVPAFSKGMNFSSVERLYFQALIQFENATTEEEKQLCQVWLSEANPGGTGSIREVDEYLAISHWVHMAILAMSETKSFQGTADEITARLGKKVSLAEVRSALERLKFLELLKEENGKLVCTYHRVTSKDDVANRGVREYHKQVARLGIEAVEVQSVLEREFQSFALSVPDSKINLAKEMIRNFRTKLSEAMSTEPGDNVFQTQIQFFRLTESPSEMVSEENEGACSTSSKLKLSSQNQ